MDFALVTIMIFILWLAAKKTKKLLKRLEPEERLAQRPMIVIKADLSAHTNSHLIDPKAASEAESKPEPEPKMVVVQAPPAVVDVPEPVFEIATADEAEAESEQWKEFDLASESEEAVGAH